MCVFRFDFYLCLVVAASVTLAAAIAQPPRFPGFGRDSTSSQGTAVGNVEAMRSGLEGIIRAASQSSSSGPTSPLIDAQTARSMEYDNQIKSTNTYFQKRKLNRMYRAEENGTRTTHEDAARLAGANTPERLTAMQCDRYTGELRWPVALRSNFYGKARDMLGSQWSLHWKAGGGIDSDQYAEIVRLTNAIQEKLKEQIKTIQSDQYLSARSFIESVRYEARFTTGAQRS